MGEEKIQNTGRKSLKMKAEIIESIQIKILQVFFDTIISSKVKGDVTI
jgi:hypothetical protein